MPNSTQESRALPAEGTPFPSPEAIGDWPEAASATDRLEVTKLVARLKTLGLVAGSDNGVGLSAATVESVLVRVAQRVRQGDLFLSRRDDDAFLERVMRMAQRKFGGRLPASSLSPVTSRGQRVLEAGVHDGFGPRCPNPSAGRHGTGEMLKRPV